MSWVTKLKALVKLKMLLSRNPSNLADSIIAECKERAAHRELDTALQVLVYPLDQRSEAHPKRKDLLIFVASALLVRFWHGGQRQDLARAISLSVESCKVRRDGTFGLTSSQGSQFQVCNLYP
jgi:hypothetical protein